MLLPAARRQIYSFLLSTNHSRPIYSLQSAFPKLTFLNALNVTNFAFKLSLIAKERFKLVTLVKLCSFACEFNNFEKYL